MELTELKERLQLVVVPVVDVRPEVIRAWAAEHGLRVESAGRLTTDVIDAFVGAHQ